MRLFPLFTELSLACPARLKLKHHLVLEAKLLQLCSSQEHSWSARFTSSGKAKAPSSQTASPCEAKPYGEAILASPSAKKKAFKVKPKASQSKGGIFQSPRVSVLDWLGSVNTDLRDYLSNKQKPRSEEPVHVSPSQCGRAGCQFVTAHYVHCCNTPGE